MNSVKPCTEDECEKPHYAKGRCRSHYNRHFVKQKRESDPSWYEGRLARNRGRSRGGRYYTAENRRNKHLRQRYGISQEMYLAMYEMQEGCCAICGEHRDTLHIDHDHSTGEVRGLLCFSCNGGLGSFKDDPKRIAAALSYLLNE